MRFCCSHHQPTSAAAREAAASASALHSPLASLCWTSQLLLHGVEHAGPGPVLLPSPTSVRLLWRLTAATRCAPAPPPSSPCPVQQRRTCHVAARPERHRCCLTEFNLLTHCSCQLANHPWPKSKPCNHLATRPSSTRTSNSCKLARRTTHWYAGHVC